MIDLWETNLAISYSESRTFYLDNDCCADYQIHFLNEFGADDYVYGYNQIVSAGTTEQQFEKVMTTFPRPNMRGITTLQKRGTKTIDLFVRVEMPEQLIWLKELIDSPNIFLLERGSNVPIAVTIANNSDSTLFDKPSNLREIKLSFERSGKDYSQRN